MRGREKNSSLNILPLFLFYPFFSLIKNSGGSSSPTLFFKDKLGHLGGKKEDGINNENESV